MEMIDAGEESQASSDVEVIDAGGVSQRSSDMEVIDIDEESSSDIEILAQPGSDAVPLGNTIARAIRDRPAAEPEEDSEVARSETDIAPPPFVDSAVERLTADLAAFCFDELERSLMLPVRNEDHRAGGTDDFEGELRVRFISQMIESIPIPDPFRSPRLQRGRGPVLQVLPR